MTKPESDTSGSEPRGEGGREEPTHEDSDALFDALLEENVLAVEGTVGEDAAAERADGEDAAADEDGGRVRTTDAFDDTHAVYHDSYVGVPDEEFHEAVAATFGLPDADAAADLLEARDVSRSEFVVYLAVRSHLDGGSADAAASADPNSSADPRSSADPYSPADLAAMAGMVHEVVPDSPVPAPLADATDDPEGFVAERDRAVVTVWKRFCDPCESLAASLDAVLDAVPDDVPVVGIDGEVDTDFCETYGVEAAPGVVLVGEADHRTVTGADASAAADAIRSFFEE